MPRPPSRDEPFEGERPEPTRPRATSWASDDRHADLLARIGTPVAAAEPRGRDTPDRGSPTHVPPLLSTRLPAGRQDSRAPLSLPPPAAPLSQGGPAFLSRAPSLDRAAHDARSVAERLAEAGDRVIAPRGVIPVEPADEPLLSWRELVFMGALAATCLGYAWVELDRAPSVRPPRAAAVEEAPERPIYEWSQEERERFVPPPPDEASFIPETDPPGERFSGLRIEELLPGVPDDQILVVTSAPAGALVTLGDERLGITPLVLAYPLRVGTELVVTLEGYRPARGKVAAVERGRRRLDVALAADAPPRRDVPPR
jgi:hypothetical protein